VRFAQGAGGGAAVPTFSPLRVEGAIRHPKVGEAWEYAVTISITNDRGEEVARQIVGVGAIEPGEQRKFTFSVDVFTPGQPADVETNGASLVDVPARKR
jgi:hypothetical protein